MDQDSESDGCRVLVQFVSENDELLASPLDLPLDVSAERLQLLCNALLQQVCST